MPSPLLILLLTVATYASVWNGKADTKWYKDSESEFTITTAEQLAGLAKLVNKGNDFTGKTFKLGANIMLNDTANWQNWDKKAPKNKWKPIGYYKYTRYGNIGPVLFGNNEYNPFLGTFDGNGFIVSGIYVNVSDPYAGLFGYAIANIKNLGVTASYIEGGSYTGGLVGNFRAGTISNCYFSGTVIGSLFVGGLAGEARDSKIINSYSISMVTGEKEVGGLVGRLSLLGNIINSYSTGIVTGGSDIGGLVGGIGVGNIINSYSTSMVTADSVVGGFVGKFYMGEITNSYSSGMVTGGSVVGGFVGHSERDSKIINSYYDNEASKQNYSMGKIEDDRTKVIGKAEGKTTAEMKHKETYKNWDFDKAWRIDSKVNEGYPYLRTE